jgi:acetyl-CoA carboxylase carboxyltransferase component
VGTIRNFTERYPAGMLRVILVGDPTRARGSLAEPECRRIVAAVDLAERLGVPLEWFSLSAGARIAMDSGTETMDWIAAGLRRIVLFAQAGGELNVVVAGINVGGQPYCNAEATMLMHTRGALVMTAAGSMLLAGKQALDYSGGVSAEDNLGIGGYERIMGPNGQAQYWAADHRGAGALERDRLQVRIQLLGEDHERAPVIAGEDAEHDRAVEVDHRPGDLGAIFELPLPQRLG